MADIINLGAERTHRTRDNRDWTLDEMLEFVREESEEGDKVMVCLLGKDDRSFYYAQGITNMEMIALCAVLRHKLLDR